MKKETGIWKEIHYITISLSCSATQFLPLLTYLKAESNEAETLGKG